MTMNPVRRGTPESDAVVSSEDERPWPSSTSFGKFPMRENSMPGFPGGIWSTGKRGSFKLSEAAHRNAARDARLGAVNPAVVAGLRGSPSPSSTEGAGNLPFAIPLQPTSKTVRSLSHSQGQREVPQSAAQHSGQHSGHSGAGGQGAALPLGLLAEEADTESESDMGSRLTHTTSHPPMSSLMRTATLPATYEHHSNGGEAAEDYSPSSPAHTGLLRGRTFESAFANLSLDHPRQRTHWQSHLGWDDVPNINESRRHSLADIPTRRGSLAGGEPSHLSRTFTVEHAIDDDGSHYSGFAPDRPIDANSERNLTRAHDGPGGHHIPSMYIAPTVELSPLERSEIEARRENMTNMHWNAGGGRPRKQLYIVSFKCSRVDVFYLLENTGLRINEGDMVIVEADRGQDLGTVQHAKVTPDAARILKKKYSEEQYKWLMMYSRNKDGGLNPNAQLHGESSGQGQMFPDAPTTMQGSIPRDNFNNLKPKAIKRLANEHEIKMLAEKEGNEAKAKRTCQQKVAHLRLQMEILDAEWQWDFQKLIFYYYADHYINFKDLITELYRIYKTRIWLSAINPASFSQHAIGSAPNGIGPGALTTPYNPYALNNAYTMAYGEDRDPYGAQMPYRIPYDTYTPNFPAIPGVANSFAPSTYDNGQNYMFYGNNNHQGDASTAVTSPAQAGEETTPTAEAHNAPAHNAPADYNPLSADYGAFFLPPTTDANRNGGIPHLSFEQVSRSSQPDLLGRTYEAASGKGYAARLNESISFGNSSNIPGVIAPPSNLPNPIGTARPTSQGVDYGGFRGGWSANLPYNADGNNGNRMGFNGNVFMPQSGVIPNPLYSADGNNGNRTGFNGNVFTPQSGGANPLRNNSDEAAGREETMNQFLAQLPAPTGTKDASRDR